MLAGQSLSEEQTGATVNVFSGEGGGKSSCSAKRTTKGEMTYEVKVYSNDLDGANEAVSRAITLVEEQLNVRLNNKGE